MSKLLLIHNSDKLFESLSPPDKTRPLFYWYTDRFVHHQGTTKYLYLFLVNPKEDNIRLRCRSGEMGFDDLHKGFLKYKDHHDVEKKDRYSESGIAMSFDELKPDLVLMARSYGSSKEEWLQTDYEIVHPMKPFSKRVIKLFKKPYDDTLDREPIRFVDIPELVELLPELKDALPNVEIEPDENGNYHYDDWLPMITEKNGTWL